MIPFSFKVEHRASASAKALSRSTSYFEQSRSAMVSSVNSDSPTDSRRKAADSLSLISLLKLMH